MIVRYNWNSRDQEFENREKIVEAFEEAQLEYEAVKYQHSHESSIALKCLEQAQEKLDEFDGVTDRQRIKELERQLAEARDMLLQVQDHMHQLSCHTSDGWVGTFADDVSNMIEDKLKEQSE